MSDKTSGSAELRKYLQENIGREIPLKELNDLCTKCGLHHWDRVIRNLIQQEGWDIENKRGQWYKLRSHTKLPITNKRGCISKKLRYLVFERDNYTCRACGRTPSTDGVKLSPDHIIPVDWGGETSLDNLQALCRECNEGMDTFRADVKAGLGTAEPTQPTTTTADTAIKEGSLVKITGNKYYGGQNIPAWVKAKNWYVRSIKGDRVVIDKSEDEKNAICSPVKASDLAFVGSTASAPTPTYRVHTVANGDTLWGLSSKYLGKGARYTEIMKLNTLTSTVLRLGQKLNIPN